MRNETRSISNEKCLAANGNLATIKDSFTSALLSGKCFIQFLIRFIKNKQFLATLEDMICNIDIFTWLGGNLVGGKWQWHDGTPFSYTNWAQG